MTYPIYSPDPLRVTVCLLDEITALREDRDKWMEEAGRVARLCPARQRAESEIVTQNNKDLRARCKLYREERDELELELDLRAKSFQELARVDEINQVTIRKLKWELSDVRMRSREHSKECDAWKAKAENLSHDLRETRAAYFLLHDNLCDTKGR
jgi:chromosome segregation ATPase